MEDLTDGEFRHILDDPKVGKAMKALADHCQELTVLGSFPIAELAE